MSACTYPNASPETLYRYARCALQEARDWRDLLRDEPWPARTAGRMLAICELLVEADELRALARWRRQ